MTKVRDGQEGGTGEGRRSQVGTTVNTIVGVLGIIVTVGSITIGWSLVAVISGLLLLAAGAIFLIRSWMARKVVPAVIATTTIIMSSFLVGGGIAQLLPSQSISAAPQGGDTDATSRPSAAPDSPAASLDSTTPSSPEVSPVPTSASAAKGSSIKRSTGDKPISLTAGYSVNLDSEELNWEIKQGPGGDLYLWGGLNSSLGMATSGSVSYVEGTPDITQCKEATDLQPKVATSYLRKGTSFCLMSTSEERIAWVSITGRTDDPYQIRIEVTVWEESA